MGQCLHYGVDVGKEGGGTGIAEFCKRNLKAAIAKGQGTLVVPELLRRREVEIMRVGMRDEVFRLMRRAEERGWEVPGQRSEGQVQNEGETAKAMDAFGGIDRGIASVAAEADVRMTTTPTTVPVSGTSNATRNMVVGMNTKAVEAPVLPGSTAETAKVVSKDPAPKLGPEKPAATDASKDPTPKPGPEKLAAKAEEDVIHQMAGFWGPRRPSKLMKAPPKPPVSRPTTSLADSPTEEQMEGSSTTTDTDDEDDDTETVPNIDHPLNDAYKSWSAYWISTGITHNSATLESLGPAFAHGNKLVTQFEDQIQDQSMPKDLQGILSECLDDLQAKLRYTNTVLGKLKKAERKTERRREAFVAKASTKFAAAQAAASAAKSNATTIEVEVMPVNLQKLAGDSAVIAPSTGDEDISSTVANAGSFDDPADLSAGSSPRRHEMPEVPSTFISRQSTAVQTNRSDNDVVRKRKRDEDTDVLQDKVSSNVDPKVYEDDINVGETRWFQKNKRAKKQSIDPGKVALNAKCRTVLLDLLQGPKKGTIVKASVRAGDDEGDDSGIDVCTHDTP